MEYEVAKARVLAFLNQGKSSEKLMVHEPAEQQPYGWVFHYAYESLFHPRLKEVEQKLKNCIQQSQSEVACLEALTSEERTIYENANDHLLAGNRPIFIDKDTGGLMFCSNYSTEIDMQLVREQKTGKQFIWKVYLKQNLRKEKAKLTSLRQELNKTPVEILQLIDKCNQNEPFWQTDKIEELVRIKLFLKELEIQFEVVEFEK